MAQRSSAIESRGEEPEWTLNSVLRSLHSATAPSPRLREAAFFDALIHMLDHPDDILRSNVLVLLMEIPTVIISSAARLELLYSVVAKFVEQRSHPVIPHTKVVIWKTQLIAALTTLTIAVDAVTAYPERHTALLSMLLDIVCSSDSHRRVLRVIAIESLRELELAQPCLLSPLLGFVFHIAQTEQSRVRQSLLALLCTITDHTISTFLDGAPPFLRSTDDSSPLLAVPSASQRHSAKQLMAMLKRAGDAECCAVASLSLAARLALGWIPAAQLSESTMHELRRVCALLLDAPSFRYTSAMLVYLLPHFVALASVLKLPDGALRSFVLPVVASNDFAYIHCVSRICRVGAAARTAAALLSFETGPLVKRLLVLLGDAHFSSELRCAATAILPLLLTDIGNMQAPLLFNNQLQLYPTPFDSIRVCYAKLLAFRHCFLPAPSPYAPPVDILEIFVCFSHFSYFSPRHPLTFLYFGAQKAFLAAFPELFVPIVRGLVRILLKKPVFVGHAVALCDDLAESGKEIQLGLIRCFASMILSLGQTQESVRRIVEYFPLLLRIAAQREIDATQLVLLISFYMEQLLDSRPDRSSKLWSDIHCAIDVLDAFLRRADPLPKRQAALVRSVLLECADSASEFDVRVRAAALLQLRGVGSPMRFLSGAALVERSGSLATTVQAGRIPPVRTGVRQIAPFLELVRIDSPASSPSIQWPSCARTASRASDGVGETSEPMKSSNEVSIFIRFCCRYAKGVARGEEETIPSCVFAAKICIGEHAAFRACCPVEVPFLAQPSVGSESEDGSFPFCSGVVLEFVPRLFPICASFDADVTFSDITGSECRCSLLDHISVRFSDLMLPALLDATDSERWCLFNNVVEYCEACEVQSAKTAERNSKPVLDGERDANGACTVRIVNLESGVAEDAFRRKLGAFEVVGPPTDLYEWFRSCELPADLVLARFYLVLLAPKSHIAVRVFVRRSQTDVRAWVDWWPALAWLDEWFDDLSS